MKKNLALTIFVSIAGVLFVGGVLWATTKVVYRDREIEKYIESLKQEESQIKTENQTLKDAIAFQQTPDAQEMLAKQKLDLQKPDENVVVIKPGAQTQISDQAQTEQTAGQTQSQSNFKKWWSYFFAFKQ